MKYKLQQLDRRKILYDQYKWYIDGPSGQERCFGRVFMIINAYQSIGIEKTVFVVHFQGSRQMLLNTLSFRMKYKLQQLDRRKVLLEGITNTKV